MTVHSQEQQVAAIFVGGGDTPIEKIASNALMKLQEASADSPQAADKLNVLWSAIDIAKLLTKRHWHVMTGGYYMGNLGMASKTADVISSKQNDQNRPMGVVFADWFPNDPLTIKGKVSNATSLSERQQIYFEKSQVFFILGGGGLGTLSEIFSSFKDDALHDEVLRYGIPGEGEDLRLRPFLVVDPTEKVHGLLRYVFNDFFDPIRRSSDPLVRGLLDRVYMFGKESFTQVGSRDYPGLLRLSSTGKTQIEGILDHQINLIPTLPNVQTLSSYLLK